MGDNMEEAIKLSKIESLETEKITNIDNYNDNIDNKTKKIQDKEIKYENTKKNKNINNKIKHNDDNINIPKDKIAENLKNNEKYVPISNNNNHEKVDLVNKSENKTKNDVYEMDIKYESSKKTKNESKIDDDNLVIISKTENMQDMACSPIKFED